MQRLVQRVRTRWDRLRGLDFEGGIEAEAVGLDPRLAFRSTPSGNRFLASVLQGLDPSPPDSILDVGCGKGSAMRVMLRFPFARVAGIELSTEISRIARRNFARMGKDEAVVFEGDAAEFDGYGDYNMIYLYNPFPSEVMERVLDRITSSWQPDGLRRIIIYNNPVCHDQVVGRGFAVLGNYPDEWGNGIRVYRRLIDSRSRTAGG